jgi:hypothetical protein
LLVYNLCHFPLYRIKILGAVAEKFLWTLAAKMDGQSQGVLNKNKKTNKQINRQTKQNKTE